MSDYGVPADPAGVLPWTWAQQRLADNKNYWVVTASASARPHAMPVWGVWLPDTDRFWFSCSPNARKARNIAEKPQCVVTVDDTVECISVEGRARIADQVADAIDHAVANYVTKYWDDPAVHPEMEAFAPRHAIVEVTPDVAFGMPSRGRCSGFPSIPSAPSPVTTDPASPCRRTRLDPQRAAIRSHGTHRQRRTKIAEIDILADPQLLAGLDLTILKN
jgi:hypothetical protein